MGTLEDLTTPSFRKYTNGPMASKVPNTFLLGDLNWRNGYLGELPLAWKLAERSIGTTLKNTSPTVATGTSMPTVFSAEKLEGIPFHRAVCYSLPIGKI